MIYFGLVGFYGIVDYLILNPLYIFILNTYNFLIGFYGISTIVGYLMPNPLRRANPWHLRKNACVYGKVCFREKEIFKKGLKMSLPPWTWVEKKETVHGVEIDKLFLKGKVPGATVGKEEDADGLVGRERALDYWFLWKRCDCWPLLILYTTPRKMMDHNKDEEIGITLLYKNISFFISSGRESKYLYCERYRDRDRETKTHGGLEWLRQRTWTLLYWPLTSSSLFLTIPRCVVFRALHLWLFCFPARGHCRLLPYRAPGDPSPWLTVSRPKTPDRRLTTARFPVSVVGHVYIISQHPCVPIVTHVRCFSLSTQVRSAITLFSNVEHPALSKTNMQHSGKIHLIHWMTLEPTSHQ